MRASILEAKAREIIERAQELNPDADPVNIRSAAYRLAEKDKIIKSGERGSMIYSLPSGQRKGGRLTKKGRRSASTAASCARGETGTRSGL